MSQGYGAGPGQAWPPPFPPAGSTPPQRASAFRPDIEGLRGLAILMVVAFHAFPGLLEGGYVGVDVFFVISGFLITGLLVRELRETGRVDLKGFYSRRARRLLPAMALAIGATLVLSAFIVSPLDLWSVAGDGVASALSFANVCYALASGDYFAASSSPSPFLHYWSLSVEEQFYFVWPVLLIVAVKLARGPRGAGWALALIAILSLGASIIVTDAAANWAFFSLPTRAWQLALGGLLAVIALRSTRAGTRPDPASGARSSARSTVLAVVGWAGLAAVLVAGRAFDSWLAYPGAWALVPTVGAVAIIVSADGRLGPGLLLRTAPMRFLGRISYALYLWHWPLLVLPVIAVGAELPLAWRVGFVILAVVIATASTFLVEEPIRRGASTASRPRQLATAGGLVVTLAISVSIGLGAVSWTSQAAIDAARTEVAMAGSGDPADDPGTDGPAESRPNADATEPSERSTSKPPTRPRTEPRKTPPPRPTARPKPRRPAPRATPRPTPRPTPRAKPTIGLPADVRPSLFAAREDEELLRRNGCLESERATEPRRCVFGKANGRFVVALVGDSHASHWFPALKRIADDRGWRLATYVKVSCSFTDIPVRNLQLKRTYRECERFNENVVAALGALKPDLVVTSMLRWQYPVRDADASAEAQGAGIARMLDRVPGRKVLIADTPFASHDVPACLSKNTRDVRRCAVASFRRTSGDSPARERIAAKRSGGTVVNLGKGICGGPGDCPVVKDGMIVFRDEHHLTATFSRSLAPALDRALTRIIRRTN